MSVRVCPSKQVLLYAAGLIILIGMANNKGNLLLFMMDGKKYMCTYYIVKNML